MTSHDVVDDVRSLVGRRTKVGHGGTLDPAAAGVLVVCVGWATRLAEYLLQAAKRYRGEVTLGIGTDTQDAEGQVVARADAGSVLAAAAGRAGAGLVGEREMLPPMHSAVRVQGQRLYDLARAGQEAPRTPRPVTVYEAELVAFEAGERARLLFDVVCSKGTYVRTLAEDLGRALGVPAHLSFLVRTAVGPHRLRDAATLEELHEAGGLTAALRRPEAAVAHLPALRLSSDEGRQRFCRGNTVSVRAPRDTAAPRGAVYAVLGPDGELLGTGSLEGEAQRGTAALRPQKVLVQR